MKIEIITTWYNESFLAPFFLSHYSYADTIHVLLDSDTDDNTVEICSRYKNVKIEPIVFPNMFDETIKMDRMNSKYRELDCDWVFAVDSDEFIFPLPLETDPRAALSHEQDYDVVNAQIWQVYRHHTDKDLDPDLPAVTQRRHGEPDLSKNPWFTKPIIVKPGRNIRWQPGQHFLEEPKNRLLRKLNKLTGRQPRISPRMFYGAHWAMADLQFAIERRKSRRERNSRNNLDKGLNLHYSRTSEDKVREICEAHLHDPQLF